jgi:MOSC domain-containing protein YiiM
MHTGTVVGLHRSAEHTFSKQAESELTLVAGMGVEGDAHCGATVRHRSRVVSDPTAPNLRQVHFIADELLDELQRDGYAVEPGDLGENITTRGLDLHALPTGTMLCIGTTLVALTGLRNPCRQIEAFRTGLLGAVTPRNASGAIVRRGGVMGVVVLGGVVTHGDVIGVSHPPGVAVPLDRV